MKNNQPVTNTEYVLEETDSIVSKTDLKGVITYINEDFLRISGFQENELIGVSHNIVRHPDMPVEAFGDMWNSLKQNRPWTGLVKNRCKNGDFYWVVANATPIYENGECTGYMSVRSKPTQAQVSAASSAYTLFRNSQVGGLRIKDGQVVKPSPLGKFNVLKESSIKFRIITVLSALSLILLAIGGLGLYGMGQSNASLKTVYEDRTVSMGQISNIQKLLLKNRLRIAASLINPTDDVIQKNTAEVEQNIAEITKIWEVYSSTYLTSEEKAFADKFATDRKQFVVEGLKPAIAALRAKDFKLADKIVVDKIRPLYAPVEEGIQNLMELQLDVAKKEYQESIAHYNRIRIQTIAIIVLGVFLALWAMLTVILGVLRPMQKTVSFLQNIAQGNFNNLIVPERADEIGQLMNGLRSMQISLGFNIAEGTRVANENLRIKIGLDNVSTSVMISDVNRNIIYMNDAVTDLMKSAESDLRKALSLIHI